MNQTTKRSKELKEVHVGRNATGKSVTGISLSSKVFLHRNKTGWCKSYPGVSRI